jgi:hypothetical protein
MSSHQPTPSARRLDVTFAVDRTWDGARAPASEVVSARLSARSHESSRGGPDDLLWWFDAPFHDDPPPPSAPGPTDRLWEHEVVELFLANHADPVRYLEIEVGPGGHHLVLHLEGVRRPVATLLPLELTVTRDGDRWQAEVVVPAAWRSWLGPGPLRANVTAIHGVGAARRYLSTVALPGSVPDFHQPSAFFGLTS